MYIYKNFHNNRVYFDAFIFFVVKLQECLATEEPSIYKQKLTTVVTTLNVFHNENLHSKLSKILLF